MLFKVKTYRDTVIQRFWPMNFTLNWLLSQLFHIDVILNLSEKTKVLCNLLTKENVLKIVHIDKKKRLNNILNLEAAKL